MDYLSQILASPEQERTVTIKTKPTKDKNIPPEMPMDQSSANLPQPVMDLMQMQAKSMAPKPPFPPEIMAMISHPAGLRELENAGSYANQLVRRERARPNNSIDALIQMILGGQLPSPIGPSSNPYEGAMQIPGG